MQLELVVDQGELDIGGILEADPDEPALCPSQDLELVAQISARYPVSVAIDGLVNDHIAHAITILGLVHTSAVQCRSCRPAC
jgi:hypothetical protein